MTRPSRNQDRLLIEAGKKLLPELGVSGMSLQRVADEAGVNLGMFSYHFKTKANFVRKVLESIKEDAMKQAQFEMPAGATSIEKLRKFLRFMGQSFRDQSGLALAMFKDFLNQDPVITELVITNSNQQFEVLQSMIRECQKDGYIDPDLPIEQIQTFCSTAIKGPVIMSAALARLQKGKKKISPKIKTPPLTDAAIGEIVDMVLRGLEPRKSKK